MGAVQFQILGCLGRGTGDKFSVFQELLGYTGFSVLYFSTVVSREDTEVCSSVPSAGILIRKDKAITLGTRLGLVKCVLRTALVIPNYLDHLIRIFCLLCFTNKIKIFCQQGETYVNRKKRGWCSEKN